MTSSPDPRAALKIALAEIEALRIDLAGARNITRTQQEVIERLQAQLRRLRAGQGGWGDR